MKRLENQCPCCLKLSTKSRTMAKLAQADKFKEVEEAMKQHAALLAVAEAASKAVKASNSRFERGIMTEAELASDTVVELAATELALATLAQIQKGE